MRKRFPDPAGTWTHDDARTMLDEWRRSGDSIAALPLSALAATGNAANDGFVSIVIDHDTPVFEY